MSFSKDVKDEICRNNNKSRHCQMAEIAALFFVCGQISYFEEKKVYIKLITENLTVAEKYFILMKKAFDFSPDLIVRNSKSRKKVQQMEVRIVNQKECKRFCKAMKYMDENGNWISEDVKPLIHTKLIVQNCCKRAFIRGLFLAAGSVTDPEYGYHFEIVLGNKRETEEVTAVLSAFGVYAKTAKRKKNTIIYVKEGSQIVDLLNIMEAHVALMKFENVRILKDMRNTINRQVNCEAANINKTVSAAARQLEDIYYIRDELGFGVLSENLAKIAELRLEHDDASLKELGEMLDPPIGKSGVNHRLRKISETADVLRRQHEEENQ